MLEAAGKTVILGGNIGLPLLDQLPDITPETWVVYEMSNFQLIDAKKSPQIAVCLMVVPEHLEWHPDAAEYYAAKANIFSHQSASDRAVYNAKNTVSTDLAGKSPAAKITYDVSASAADKPQYTDGAYVEGDTIYMHGTPVCKTVDVALLGRHNLENVCAAVAAVWEIIDGNTEAIVSVIKSFGGLEHRLEFVREVDGVKFYNDSFSTTPETASAAIKAFDQPKVVILGGFDKGIPFDSLADTVAAANVSHVVAIGKTSTAITGLLADRAGTRQVAVTNFGPDAKPSMEEIIAECRAHSKPGDVVLLSTGCASFGMFQNYKERGEAFRAAVNKL